MERELKMIKRKITMILFLLSALAILIVVALTSGKLNFEFYSKMSDDEWIELEYYNGKRENYLGKYPGDIFCNVYNLKGIEKNELLYLDGSYVVGAGSNRYTKILLNKEFDEPTKRLSIKQILITKTDNSTVRIDDRVILNQIEQVLKNQAGDPCGLLLLEFNTRVCFESECDLSWKCIIEKRNDGSICLIGYNQKECQFRCFNVTSILDEVY